MSLKAELEIWAKALEFYDKSDYDASLIEFEKIADRSQIFFNIGLIHATLGEHEIAVQKYVLANDRDQYLAVSYFQCGVSNFLMGNFEQAHRDFEEAYVVCF